MAQKNNYNNQQKIINQKIEKLLSEKFGAYSKYIIQDRALPDLRDGLKPVQRRILYAMHKLNLTSHSAYKKSARVVGDVIGKYHPHGDSSVYEAMVRMSQEWKMNSPLIDMHGNKGSIDGDSAAAMRYTETRLTFLSKYLLENIEQNLVKFTNNFDDSEKEPVVLPAQFPNILVNGSTGIAAGYSTNIPPHNFNEVLESLLFLLKNPRAKFSDIIKILKGPDFPTGGIIRDKQEIIQVYQNGKGKITIRGKYHLDRENKSIVFTEIPYEANKSEIIKKISILMEEEKVSEIEEIRDDSGREGLKIVINLKNFDKQEAILNFLFKNTDLEKNFYANMIAIFQKRPTFLNIIDILDNFIQFQIEIFTNLFEYQLQVNKEKFEITKGLLKISKVIDKVISLIKKSENKDDAKNRIKKKFLLSTKQAEAIVNLRLYRLSKTDIEKLKIDLKSLQEKINFYQRGIYERSFLIKNIIKNITELNQKIIVPRKTQFEKFRTQESMVFDPLELMQEENFLIGISVDGFIKKIELNEKRKNNLENYKLKDHDGLIFLEEISNFDKLFFFTSFGKFYSLNIHNLEISKINNIGANIFKYLTFSSGEKIIAIKFGKQIDDSELLIVTKFGYSKKINSELLPEQTQKSGNKFISLAKDDQVVSVNFNFNFGDFLTLISKNGNLLRRKIDLINNLSLSASGSKCINLKEKDYLISGFTSDRKEVKENGLQILLLTTNGLGKRFRISELESEEKINKTTKILKFEKNKQTEICYAVPLTYDNRKFLIFTNSGEAKIFKVTKELVISNLKTGMNLTKLKTIERVFPYFKGEKEVSKKVKVNQKKSSENNFNNFNVKKLLEELEELE